jgi:hypothetical protein
VLDLDDTPAATSAAPATVDAVGAIDDLSDDEIEALFATRTRSS